MPKVSVPQAIVSLESKSLRIAVARREGKPFDIYLDRNLNMDAFGGD